jgi:hypothetical protein
MTFFSFFSFFFLFSLPGMKRHREDELFGEIEEIKTKISVLEAALGKWKGKADEAEKSGNKQSAEGHLGRYDTINTQLASLQQRLVLKEGELAEERQQKREKVVGSGKNFFFHSFKLCY